MKLGKLFSGIVGIATLPLSIAADVMTLGNAGEKPFTKSKLEKIEHTLDQI